MSGIQKPNDPNAVLSPEAPTDSRRLSPGDQASLAAMATRGNVVREGKHQQGEILGMFDGSPRALLGSTSGRKSALLTGPIGDIQTAPDGATQRGLFGIICAGDSAYAVVGVGEGKGAWSSLGLVELAVGKNARNDGEPATGIVRGTIDAPAANDYTVKRYGRDELGGDEYMSRTHFSLVVKGSGVVEVIDGGANDDRGVQNYSLNGTLVLTDRTAESPDAIALVAEANKVPLTWQEAPADLEGHVRVAR